MPGLRLAVALRDAGWHPAAWREDPPRGAELLRAGYWLALLAEAERGLLDLVTIDDAYGLQLLVDDRLPSPRRVRARLDAVQIAARVAPRTSGIGILPAVPTRLTEPFAVSSAIATLDHMTRGRAGWQALVSTSDHDAGYIGPLEVVPGPATFAEALEHIEAVRCLWDSWEDDAEIRDAASGRFVDSSRLHHIDFRGEHFSVLGPSITPRPPQGQPPVAILLDDPRAIALAAGGADLVFLAAPDDGQVGRLRRRLDETLAEAGREPSSVIAFTDMTVFLDGDPGAAVARRDRLDDLDDARDGAGALSFSGSPAELADSLMALIESGHDGFRLRPAVIPRDLAAITRELVPELQSRGAFRKRYEAASLRALLGLERPRNRYASVLAR